MAIAGGTLHLPGAKVLRSTLWVPRPTEAAWAFFSEPTNLPLLTPSAMQFHILTPVPIHMQVDTRIDYRLRVRGIPLRWRTRIARWEPPFCFADEQERGPYRRWLHTHTFEAVNGGTLLGDRVEMAVRGGPLAPLISRCFVEADVLRIFRYRLAKIVERFGGDLASGRVWLETPAAT